MFTRQSLQAARATRIREELKRLAEHIITLYIVPAAEHGDTRVVLTPSLVSQGLASMRKQGLPAPPDTPSIVELQVPMDALLPDVDVYVVTQLAHPDAYTSTRLDTLTVDWS